MGVSERMKTEENWTSVGAFQETFGNPNSPFLLGASCSLSHIYSTVPCTSQAFFVVRLSVVLSHSLPKDKVMLRSRTKYIPANFVAFKLTACRHVKETAGDATVIKGEAIQMRYCRNRLLI